MTRIRYPTVEDLVKLNKEVLRRIPAKKADRPSVLTRNRLESDIEKVRREGMIDQEI